jgi:hypothetical protein
MMLTIMQILGYFKLIVYVYILFNRVLKELHVITTRKAYFHDAYFSRRTCFRRPPGRGENRRLRNTRSGHYY